ncbi:hypothetical protein ACP70R_044974 [Stipagrostis hirtigluma subsp. patula]
MATSPLPSPDAQPPPNPLPVPTPGPAATSTAATAALPSLTASGSPSSVSSPSECYVLKGRTKEQRWTDSSPSSSSGGSTSLTFRDALLTQVSGSVAVPAPAMQVEPRPVKIVLKTRRRQVPAPAAPDAQGWQKVEGRRARKARLRELRGPHRPVPVDLQGRCFNCFSWKHRAADCRRGPRCFRCQELGHRSFDCVGRKAAPTSNYVWRRVTKPSVTMAGEAAVGAGPGREASGRRRRRRVRKRKGLASEDLGADDASAPNEDDHIPPPDGGASVDIQQSSLAGDRPLPRRVIDRSAKIARAEAELCKALSVSVVGDSAALSVDVLATELARHYELPAESLEFHHLRSGEFMLVLPDEATALMVYDDGRPLQLPPLTVFLDADFPHVYAAAGLISCNVIGWRGEQWPTVHASWS